MTGRQKRNLIILCIIIMIGSLVELLGVSLIMPLTTVATNEAIIFTDAKYAFFGRMLGLETASEYVIALALLLIFVYVFKNMYLCFMYWCQYRYQYRNEERLALEVMDYYVSRDYLFHTSKNVADIQRNVSTDVSSFWTAVFAFTSVFNEGLVCVTLLIYLLVTDVISTVGVIILILFFLVIFYFVFKKYSIRLGAKLRLISAERTKWLLQIFGGIKEIKVTEKAPFFIGQYKCTYDEYIKNQAQQSLISILPKPVMETVCIGGMLGVVAIRVYGGVDIKSFIPTLSVFVLAAFRMLPSFNRLASYLSQIMSHEASIDNIYSDIAILRKEKESNSIVGKSNSKNISDTLMHIDIHSDIQVQNVTFRYSTGVAPVLDNLSLTVPYKKSVAMIGSSGAGKTTLADVILGIIIPQEGRIMVEGVNIFDHLKEWHEIIAYIPQTIYLTDDTIRHNIAFGVEEKNIDDSRVYEVLEKAQLLDFLRELSDGINTVVGDRGVRLSGGQRQRIGIARALYTRPQLLILDEATSALDNETETAVMEAIDNLQGSCTMIIIAHRLSTIKNCDYVYEIVNGKAILKAKKDIY